MIKFAEKRGLGIYIAGGEPPSPPHDLASTFTGGSTSNVFSPMSARGGGGSGTPEPRSRGLSTHFGLVDILGKHSMTQKKR